MSARKDVLDNSGTLLQVSFGHLGPLPPKYDCIFKTSKEHCFKEFGV